MAIYHPQPTALNTAAAIDRDSTVARPPIAVDDGRCWRWSNGRDA